MSGLPLATTLAWLLAVALSDWLHLRIPNGVLGVAAAVLLLAIGAGAHPIGLSPWQAIGGAAIVLGIGLPLYALRWVGAGDVKLMAVLGAFTGATHDLLLIWLFAALLAGLHLAGWRLLRLGTPQLRLAPADPGDTKQRRLPHGAHLAVAAAFVFCCMPVSTP